MERLRSDGALDAKNIFDGLRCACARCCRGLGPGAGSAAGAGARAGLDLGAGERSVAADESHAVGREVEYQRIGSRGVHRAYAPKPESGAAGRLDRSLSRRPGAWTVFLLPAFGY